MQYYVPYTMSQLPNDWKAWEKIIPTLNALGCISKVYPTHYLNYLHLKYDEIMTQTNHNPRGPGTLDWLEEIKNEISTIEAFLQLDIGKPRQ